MALQQNRIYNHRDTEGERQKKKLWTNNVYRGLTPVPALGMTAPILLKYFMVFFALR